MFENSKKHTGRGGIRLLAIGCLAAAGLTAQSVHAQTQYYTFNVNTTADTHDVNNGEGTCNDLNGNCSLRAAIEEASSEPQPSGTETIVTIHVPTGTYILSLGELQATGNTINIIGAGPPNTIVDANSTSRVVYNTTITSIQNLTVTHGNGTAGLGMGGGFDGTGGGIYNSGSLTLVNDVVSNNTATATGYIPGCGSLCALGGGLYQAGTQLTIQSSFFTGNTATATGSDADAEGGGVYIAPVNALSSVKGSSTRHITSHAIVKRSTRQVAGFATVNVSSSKFIGNTVSATDSGGGNPFADGGGFDNDTNGDVTMTAVTISNNTVTASGTTSFSEAEGGGLSTSGTGDMHLVAATITGNSLTATATTGQASAFGGGIRNTEALDVSKNSSVSFNSVTATTTSGFAGADGGGVYTTDDAYLHNAVTISSNTLTASATSGSGGAEARGGGIRNTDHLHLDMVYVVLNKATATSQAAGFSEALGGGLHADGTASVIQNSNFSRNSLSATGAVPSTSNTVQGGGIHNDSESVNLTHSYVQSNTAPGTTGQGGGIFNTSGNSISLSYTQVNRNSAGSKGGGVYNFAPFSRVASPIISNTAPTCPNIVVPCQ